MNAAVVFLLLQLSYRPRPVMSTTLLAIGSQQQQIENYPLTRLVRQRVSEDNMIRRTVSTTLDDDYLEQGVDLHQSTGSFGYYSSLSYSYQYIPMALDVWDLDHAHFVRHETSRPSTRPSDKAPTISTNLPSTTTMRDEEERLGTNVHFDTLPPTSSPSLTITDSPSSSFAQMVNTGKPSPAPSLSPTLTTSVSPTLHITAVPSSFSSSGPTNIITTMPSSIPSSVPTPIVSGTPSPPPSGFYNAVFCNRPTERSRQFGELVDLVTPNDDDHLQTSAQWKAALDFLAYYDPRRLLCEENKVDLLQRYVLVLLYMETAGTDAPQASQSGWRICGPYPAKSECPSESMRYLSASHECEWYGTTCDEQKRVVSLRLESNGLSGTLTEELWRLSHLEVLDLDENFLRGTLPRTIGLFPLLRELDLDRNLLEGSLPDELFSLSTLEVLDLNFNFFTGTLSASFGDLTRLTFVQLDDNYFEGTVPTEFGSLTLLRTLTLSSNLLSGSIPPEICELRKTTTIPDHASEQRLVNLWADCAGVDPEVTCHAGCCTLCFL